MTMVCFLIITVIMAFAAIAASLALSLRHAANPNGPIVDLLSDGQERRAPEIAKATGLWAGTLYPALAELERRGIVQVDRRWHPEHPVRVFYYRIASAWASERLVSNTQ